jgi:glycosyltransferase involved in cell wall biosynthesis
VPELTPPPRISVVVPALNRAKYLPATLASILSQDYPNIECLVMDGGSKDGTQELLAAYGSRIQWLSEPDVGPYDAINKGWNRTTGEIVTWLNADDLWADGAAAKVAEWFAAHPETDVLAGTCAYFDEAGRHVFEYHAEWDIRRVVSECDCTIYQPSTFYRRSAVERVGGLRNFIPHDFDLWLRMSLAGCMFGTVPDLLAKTRIQDDNISHNPALMIPGILRAIRSFLDSPDLPPALRPIRARALRNAHLWGFLYLLKPGQPSHWLWAARCVIGACRADPTAIPYIVGRFVSGSRMRLLVRQLAGRALSLVRRYSIISTRRPS